MAGFFQRKRSRKEKIFWGISVTLIVGSVILMFGPMVWFTRVRSKKAQARKEMSDIKIALESCRQQYSQWPMTQEALSSAKPDFTYGTWEVAKEEVSVLTRNGRGYQANNSEAVVILMGEAHPKFNPNYTNNPQKKVFLNPPRDNQEDGKPGIGPSRVFLDPWGHPYIISLDGDGDGWVEDAFYSRAKVSAMFTKGAKGVRGLESRGGEGKDDFGFKGSVMIWSFGPDGKADPNIGADEGVNRDNIVSWAF